MFYGTVLAHVILVVSIHHPMHKRGTQVALLVLYENCCILIQISPTDNNFGFEILPPGCDNLSDEQDL